MGHQVIKEPNDSGLLAVWSTVVDDFIIRNATREEIVEYYSELAAERAAETAHRVLDAVEEGRPEDIYHQFTMTFEEAKKTRRRLHESSS
jgi:uncharacterized protein (UPF0371 family)